MNRLRQGYGGQARAALALAVVFAGAWLSAAPQVPDGAAIFARDCSSCHDGAAGSRAPAPDVLKRRSPEAILSALTAGAMRPQGGRLSGAERRAVAEHLSGRALGGDITGAKIGRCTASAPQLPNPGALPYWVGWSASPLGGNTRFQFSALAGLTAEQVPKLSLKWAFGFPDATSAWSQPTVAAGRLFVGSQNGTVYALDAKSGCVYWTFTAKAGVRTALTYDEDPQSRQNTVYFGDTGANVYALDAETGRERWSRTVDSHPLARITGSLTIGLGRLFVPVSSIEETAASQPGYQCCTFRGSLNALNPITGEIQWRTFMVPEPRVVGKTAAGVPLWGPSGVGIWSTPTLDFKRRIIYAATGNAYSAPAQPTADAIIAVDPFTGAIKWIKQLTAGDVFGCRAGSANCGEKAGPDFDFGTPAMLTGTRTRELIVAAQKSGVVYALDPEREGEIVWQYRAGEGSIWGGIQWGAAADTEKLYLPVSDIRNPKPGGLHAVNLATGERAWYVPPPPLKCAAGTGCSAALISAPTLIPGVLFSGSNDGALRAHATADGSVIWEFDTNREFETLNGIKAGGGAIQGPGPTIVGGMLYLNSGYGDHLGRPGNVLLAFEVQ
jgi:polyvinyl alcohol dehydrogenase (cytochrome)